MRTLTLPADSPPFTKADWDRLPEGFPAQLVDGVLLKEPSRTYAHQQLVARLLDSLRACVSRDAVLGVPFDVWIDDYNVYQPDLLVLREIPLPDACFTRRPRLVMEVLAPDTVARDRTFKTPKYLQGGVEEVWLIDPMRQTVERHDRDGVLEARGSRPLSSREIAGYGISAQALFGPAWPDYGSRAT